MTERSARRNPPSGEGCLGPAYTGQPYSPSESPFSETAPTGEGLVLLDNVQFTLSWRLHGLSFCPLACSLRSSMASGISSWARSTSCKETHGRWNWPIAQSTA